MNAPTLPELVNLAAVFDAENEGDLIMLSITSKPDEGEPEEEVSNASEAGTRKIKSLAAIFNEENGLNALSAPHNFRIKNSGFVRLE